MKNHDRTDISDQLQTLRRDIQSLRAQHGGDAFSTPPHVIVQGREIQAWSPLEEAVAKFVLGVIRDVCGPYPCGVARAIEHDWICRETVTRGESLPEDFPSLKDVLKWAGVDNYDMVAEYVHDSRRFAAESRDYGVILDEGFDDLVRSQQGQLVPESIAERSRSERARREE